MNDIMESKWCLDPSGKRIITDDPSGYNLEEVVFSGGNVSAEMLAHICAVHNEWLEDRWASERFCIALEKDD